jgi:hypothetical protein
MFIKKMNSKFAVIGRDGLVCKVFDSFKEAIEYIRTYQE